MQDKTKWQIGIQKNSQENELIEAAKQGNLYLLSQLIAKGANINFIGKLVNSAAKAEVPASFGGLIVSYCPKQQVIPFLNLCAQKGYVPTLIDLSGAIGSLRYDALIFLLNNGWERLAADNLYDLIQLSIYICNQSKSETSLMILELLCEKAKNKKITIKINEMFVDDFLSALSMKKNIFKAKFPCLDEILSENESLTKTPKNTTPKKQASHLNHINLDLPLQKLHPELLNTLEKFKNNTLNDFTEILASHCYQFSLNASHENYQDFIKEISKNADKFSFLKLKTISSSKTSVYQIDYSVTTEQIKTLTTLFEMSAEKNRLHAPLIKPDTTNSDNIQPLPSSTSPKNMLTDKVKSKTRNAPGNPTKKRIYKSKTKNIVPSTTTSKTSKQSSTDTPQIKSSNISVSTSHHFFSTTSSHLVEKLDPEDYYKPKKIVPKKMNTKNKLPEKTFSPDQLKSPGKFSLMYTNSVEPLKNTQEKITNTLKKITLLKYQLTNQLPEERQISLLTLRHLIIQLISQLCLWLKIQQKNNSGDVNLIKNMNDFYKVLSRCFDLSDFSNTQLLNYTDIIIAQWEKTIIYDANSYQNLCVNLLNGECVEALNKRYQFINTPFIYYRSDEPVRHFILKMKHYLEHIHQIDKIIFGKNFENISDYTNAIEFCIHQISLAYAQSAEIQNLIKSQKDLSPTAELFDSLSENTRQSKYGFSDQNAIGSQKTLTVMMKILIKHDLLSVVKNWLNQRPEMVINNPTQQVFQY